MIVVSPILKRVVYPALANSGYLRRHAQSGSFCTLTYHGVLPPGYKTADPQLDGCLVSAENFRAQLRLLKEIYRVVSPEEVRDWLAGTRELPERAILLTCDDGLLNALTDMAPILHDEGVSSLFFVPGVCAVKGVENPRMLWDDELYLLLLAAPAGTYSLRSLDSVELNIELLDRAQRRAVWWNVVKKLSRCDQAQRISSIEFARERFGLSDECTPEHWNDAQRRRFGLLDVDQLRQLVDMGMTIGSHTLNHSILAEQSSETAWQEISQSRGLLENAIGKPVWALSYPFGDPGSVTAREMLMAEQAGYQCAFVNVGGGFGATLPRFALPRVHVTADMSLAEFEAHVSGFHRDFRARLG